jgi:magnesium chelatase family protein
VVTRHSTKLSGALLDRIDIVLRVDQPSREELSAAGEAEASAAIRARVIAARRRQQPRLSGSGATCNAELSAAQVRRVSSLDPSASRALSDAHDHGSLTMRGHDRVLRVARTLADLEGCEHVQRHHVTEAVAYRVAHRLDRWEVSVA